jgi:hypothetical protein
VHKSSFDATTNSYAKTPQTYEQRRDFASEIFLHPDDFFLDNFGGGDYEMLLALPAKKFSSRDKIKMQCVLLVHKRSPEKTHGHGSKGGQKNDRPS